MKLTNYRCNARRSPALLALTLIGCLTCYRAVAADGPRLSLDDARHLLLRTGLGASAAELQQTIGKTRAQAVDRIVSGIRTTPSLPMPAWTQRPAPHHWARANFSRSQRRGFNESRDREIDSLRVWWVRQMIETDSPQTERLVMMWHNHFATAYSGVNSQSISMARQHQLFRQHGAGNLEDLLKQVIRDVALLNYLDNDKSRKQSPNENLARELLELFTLGEGNYTESDVKSAAQALTGYSVAPMRNLTFRFKANMHDNDNKRLFGQTGHFNGDDLIDLILQQPQTARFIASRYWRTFISDLPPQPAELQPLVNAFRDSGLSLRSLYRATLMSDAFWNRKYRATIVKSPVSLTIGAIRSTGIVPLHWQTLPATLATMGQNLFEPPNVAGWPGGAHWITPSRLLTRLDWLERFAQRCTTPNCNDVIAPDSIARDSTAPDSTALDSTAIKSTASGSMASSMTSNQMAASMMQADAPVKPSMSAESRMMTDTGAGESISIRLASEDFDDAAQFQLSIYRASEKLWTTGAVSVAGGHNSKKLGRLKMNQFVPWQQVEFHVDTDVAEFDRIDVEFLNDAAKDGADRNLFIDQVLFKGERFSASRGTQQSKCPPKRAEHAGRLYCNGTLMLPRTRTATAVSPGSTTPDTVTPVTRETDNRFTAEAVYLQTGAKNKSDYLNFALTNVILNDSHWHSLSFRIANIAQLKNKNKPATAGNKPRYFILLNNTSCWPDCIKQWPPCAKASKPAAENRRASFSVSVNRKKDDCYHSLNDSDQALIDTLEFNLERIFQAGFKKIPAKRQQLLDSVTPWSAVFAKMSHQYMQLNSYNPGNALPPSLELVSSANADPFTEANFMRGTPLAEKHNSEQQALSWNELKATTKNGKLADLLLATEPLGKIDRSSLSAVLSDLSTQLQ